MAPGNMKSDFVGLQRNKISGRSAQTLARKVLPASSRLGSNATTTSSGPAGYRHAVNMALDTAGTTGAARGGLAPDPTVACPTISNNNSSGNSGGSLYPRSSTMGDGTMKKNKSTNDHNRGTSAAGGSEGEERDEDGEDGLILVDDGEGGRLVERHEVEHLKALSMLHLDVIEQQQNELQRREKELQRVRAQNDTLKARLERIQRRTILAQKHQEPLLNHVHISAGDSPLPCKRKNSLDVSTPVKRQQTDKEATPTKMSTPSTPGNATPGSATPSNATPTRRGRQLKSKAKEQQRPRGRERATPVKEERASVGRRPGGAAPPTPRRGALAAEERTPRREGPAGSKVKEERRNNGEGERGGGASSGGSGSIKPEQYLKTNVIYPCLSDLRVTDPDPALPEGQTVVQVPSWRLNVLTSSPGAEIAEDLEDTTYERRHQKYEIAEQKRKRWDIQRVRELREHERLEQKMLRREYGNWDDVLKTFYPEPSDACQLQVSDTVPLVAFGVQVPIAKDVSEFELPWFDLDQRDKDESRRQTRSRTNRR